MTVKNRVLFDLRQIISRIIAEPRLFLYFIYIYICAQESQRALFFCLYIRIGSMISLEYLYQNCQKWTFRDVWFVCVCVCVCVKGGGGGAGGDLGILPCPI